MQFLVWGHRRQISVVARPYTPLNIHEHNYGLALIDLRATEHSATEYTATEYSVIVYAAINLTVWISFSIPLPS